ncbi:MAG: adenylate/guanylate cyclase domain-containing protein [Dongiaceae bacterium]
MSEVLPAPHLPAPAVPAPTVPQPAIPAAAAAAPRPARRRRFGLRLALTLLVVLSVALTAALIHVTWSWTARRNVADVASQLNAQIVDSVRHELRATLDGAWSVQQSLLSIMTQEAIKPTDEAKREFVFLALLQSQPSVSWVSFGFPDGNFFGAQKEGDDRINMVEVQFWDALPGVGMERIDRYRPGEKDPIEFIERQFHRRDYDATRQPWYRRAVAENGTGWNVIHHFPDAERQAISTSTPLFVHDGFEGVINVVIELDRLSRFLQGLTVGRSGTAVVLDQQGHVIASADPAAVRQQQAGDMPTLPMLGESNALLALVDRAVAGGRAGLGSLSGTRQIEERDAAGEAYFVTFSPLRFENWVVATVIPERDFLASIDRAARLLLAGLVLVTVLLAAAAVIAANRLIANPLLRVAAQLHHIESFRLERIVRVPSPLRELDDLSQVLVQVRAGLASFQKFIPTDLVRTLVSRGIEAVPGGRHETLTIMFTDLVGFTALSERLGDRIVEPLTEYLETASQAVTSHRGTIDKFIGDAVMAFWGAPEPNPRHAVEACAAALECRRRLAERQAGRDDAAPLAMRIGINTGSVLVGNIGSRDRLSYTVIGDPVNVASRLEPLNKRYGTGIVIGEDTRRAAGDAIVVRRLDRVAVYGRMQGLAIYELIAMAGEMAEPPAWVAAYEAGLERHAARRWDEAIACFRQAIALRGGHDRAAELLIERCHRLAAEPPPATWDGTVALDSK